MTTPDVPMVAMWHPQLDAEGSPAHIQVPATSVAIHRRAGWIELGEKDGHQAAIAAARAAQDKAAQDKAAEDKAAKAKPAGTGGSS